MVLCAICSGETISRKYRGVEITICKSCNALEITNENFKKLCNFYDPSCLVVDLFDLMPLKLKEETRTCNKCNKPMEKVFYNGVAIDRCKNCNSILFDNGEVSKYFAKFSDKPTEIVGNGKFILELLNTDLPAERKENINNYKQPEALKIISSVAEKTINSFDGWTMLAFLVILGLFTIFLFYLSSVGGVFVLSVPAIFMSCIIFFMLSGFKILAPQEALVFTMFGKYVGTLKKAGFFWVNPFATTVSPLATTLKTAGLNSLSFNSLSLKTRTLENAKQKINDAHGNPIEIGLMVTWEVRDTAKALFNVEDYGSFLSAQCDSALRNIARLYPYDSPEDSGKQSLRADSAEISEKLKIEIQNNVASAGIRVLGARITHLAYSPEIAAAMLQRQQANAIIDAKRTIVNSAVDMVEMALDKLANNPQINLGEEMKANMVNNLLVVLCGNKDSHAVIRTDLI